MPGRACPVRARGAGFDVCNQYLQSSCSNSAICMKWWRLFGFVGKRGGVADQLAARLRFTRPLQPPRRGELSFRSFSSPGPLPVSSSGDGLGVLAGEIAIVAAIRRTLVLLRAHATATCPVETRRATPPRCKGGE